MISSTRPAKCCGERSPSGARREFQRILVDEFQDTDPNSGGNRLSLRRSLRSRAVVWRRLLPGRLFMVGDPKQAIYRFRGADIATYPQARDAVEHQFPGNVVRVSSNFRSCDAILQYINRCFEAPLGAQETGYVLRSTRGPGARASVRRQDNGVLAPRIGRRYPRRRGQHRRRDLHPPHRQREIRGGADRRVLGPGDIALLAPIGRELWRYERALEDAGLPFSSQAGKNLFRRQEVQDLVALVRALADSRDTLALGALLRGPLVGLTEQELLDIVADLPPEEGRDVPRISLLDRSGSRFQRGSPTSSADLEGPSTAGPEHGAPSAASGGR